MSDLSGLSLRRAVAEKLGWRTRSRVVAKTSASGLLSKGDHVVDFINPSEEVMLTGVPVEREYLCWETPHILPHFERDLGALQASGVIDAVLTSAGAEQWNMWFDATMLNFAKGQDTWQDLAWVEVKTSRSEALATAFCRAFLAIPTDANEL